MSRFCLFLPHPVSQTTTVTIWKVWQKFPKFKVIWQKLLWNFLIYEVFFFFRKLKAWKHQNRTHNISYQRFMHCMYILPHNQSIFHVSLNVKSWVRTQSYLNWSRNRIVNNPSLVQESHQPGGSLIRLSDIGDDKHIGNMRPTFSERKLWKWDSDLAVKCQLLLTAAPDDRTLVCYWDVFKVFVDPPPSPLHVHQIYLNATKN